jgi:hypothetical protein
MQDEEPFQGMAFRASKKLDGIKLASNAPAENSQASSLRVANVCHAQRPYQRDRL